MFLITLLNHLFGQLVSILFVRRSRREVIASTLYVYSMAEVHIEFSTQLQFGPYNGGYPEQAAHLQSANLPAHQNMWYDVFDHNDPSKTRTNWSLVPKEEYEEPWWPAGSPCEPALPRTEPGMVAHANTQVGDSFGAHQLQADAETMAGWTEEERARQATQIAAIQVRIKYLSPSPVLHCTGPDPDSVHPAGSTRSYHGCCRRRCCCCHQNLQPAQARSCT
jgi:hypothetical protein